MIGRRAAQFFGGERALQRGEQRFGVAIGDGQDGNLGDRRCVLYGKALHVALGGDARRERVAGIERHVGDAAALDAVLIAHGTLREDIAVEIAILVRVGIDNAPNRAMFRGDLRFDSPPRLAVPGDDDRPFNRDAQAVKRLIVLGDAEVHVDKGAVTSPSMEYAL